MKCIKKNIYCTMLLKVMRTVLIATLGFEEKFCYRAILRHGIKEGDRIVLITAGIVDRVERAYDWIRKLVQSSYGDSVSVELVQVDVNNYVDSLRRISEILDSFEGFRKVVNLSGGMRILIIYVLLACMMRARGDLTIEVEAEDLSTMISLDWRILRLIREGVKEEHLEVLRQISHGLRDVRSLARRLNKDESTVRRYISELEELGLVEVRKRKPLLFERSELSSIFLGGEGTPPDEDSRRF